MESVSLLINRCTVLSHHLCACSHTAVFHQYACAKISNGSNLRAIATYRANLDHLVLTKPSVVSNSCISLASKLPRQFFKKGISLVKVSAISSYLIHIGNNVVDPCWMSFLPLASTNRAHLRCNFALPVLAMCTMWFIYQSVSTIYRHSSTPF